MRKRSWSLSKMDSRNFSSALSPDTDILASSPGPGLRRLTRSAAASLSPARPWPRPRLRGGRWREGPGQPQPAGRRRTRRQLPLYQPSTPTRSLKRAIAQLAPPSPSSQQAGPGPPAAPPSPCPPSARPAPLRDTHSGAGPPSAPPPGPPPASPRPPQRRRSPPQVTAAPVPGSAKLPHGPLRALPAYLSPCPCSPLPRLGALQAACSHQPGAEGSDCSPGFILFCRSALREGMRSLLPHRTWILPRKSCSLGLQLSSQCPASAPELPETRQHKPGTPAPTFPTNQYK